MNDIYLNIYNNLIKLTRNKELYNLNKQDTFYERMIIFFFHLAFLLKINKKKLDDKEIMQISNEVNEKIKNEIYSSYDIYLNNEYKVEINDNALERVNNFFK